MAGSMIMLSVLQVRVRCLNTFPITNRRGQYLSHVTQLIEWVPHAYSVNWGHLLLWAYHLALMAHAPLRSIEASGLNLSCMSQRLPLVEDELQNSICLSSANMILYDPS